MNTVALGLGSNLGDKRKNLNTAVHAISLLPSTRIAKVSGVYQTKPVGFADQDDFLNAAVIIETELSPHAILGACLGIEASMGRVRLHKNGPRIIDIDVLIYESYFSDSFELTLPHPRIKERAFVMVPLLDLFPSGRAPGLYFLPNLKEIGFDDVIKTDYDILVQ
ncbi:MAG: 2-amino-4-hydroxy-6-hydroxymethyldihydropteridine diphosphokinase [Clostridia bacterium]|nr:2-amino-4-hydroxy-6-hydroxymethyldihydropteridine diphosphokinase [Clostridia bacterium]